MYPVSPGCATASEQKPPQVKPVIEVFCFAEGGTLGTLTPLLMARNFALNIRRIASPDDVPKTIHPSSALIVLGGPMSVNDPLPWIPPLLRLLARTIEADVPVFGICLGAQLMAKSLGAKICANPQREMGWGKVDLITEPRIIASTAQSSPVNALIKKSATQFTLPVFHFHGETFTLPQSAQHLLTSEHCLHQGFTVGRSVALQCHIEPDAQVIINWTQKEAFARPNPDYPQMQTQGEILRNLTRHIDRLRITVNTLFLPWLDQQDNQPH